MHVPAGCLRSREFHGVTDHVSFCCRTVVAVAACMLLAQEALPAAPVMPEPARPAHIAAPLPIAGGTTVTVRVLDSGLSLSLTLDGYAKENSKDDKTAETHGQVILAGTLDSGKKSEVSTRITVIAEANDPPLTSEAFCKQSATSGGDSAQKVVKYFEVGKISCYEQTIYMTITSPKGASSSGTMVFFHAFPLVGSHRVEIKVSSTTFDNKNKVWERERFLKLMKTLVTKPSGPPDLAADHDLPALAVPAELGAFRTEAAAHGKTAPDWIREQCTARASDWVPQFVCGEYGDRDGLTHACELLGAKTGPTPQELNARFLAERVLGSRLITDGLAKEASAHVQLANELAGTAKLAREVRAPIVYDLACCRALTGQPDEAVKLLKEAIKLDVSLRDAASKDAAFESLKDDKGFQGLIKA
jgi:hypothetical protein